MRYEGCVFVKALNRRSCIGLRSSRKYSIPFDALASVYSRAFDSRSSNSIDCSCTTRFVVAHVVDDPHAGFGGPSLPFVGGLSLGGRTVNPDRIHVRFD